MPTLLSRARPHFLLGPLMLVMLACGASTTATGGSPAATATLGAQPSTPTLTLTPTSAPSATLTQVSTVKQVADSAQGPFSASAKCPSNTVMVSGGYSITGGTNAQQADVLDSYPASSASWSVTGLNASVGGPLTLTVFADCLKASFPVTTSLVAAGPASGTVSNSCPAGSVVTGGGYQGSGHFSSFAPSGNGWKATLFSGTTKVYAVCATGGLNAGSSPSATGAVASSGSGSATVACPAGSLLVGGGFSATPPAVVFGSRGNSTLTQWQVEASDRSFGSMSNLSVTARAWCVSL